MISRTLALPPWMTAVVTLVASLALWSLLPDESLAQSIPEAGADSPLEAYPGNASQQPAYDEVTFEGTGESSDALVIHAALDIPYALPLLEDFHRRHPRYTITYRNFSTLDVHQRFLDAPAEADVVISSAMPWQYLLVNEGHAQSIDTAITQRWPDSAKWRQELFAFTFEPIVMVVSRRLEQRLGPVDSRADLLGLLAEARSPLQGRLVTYDPTSSGAGYTYAIEESRLSPRYWDLVAALGKADTALVNTTGAMLEGLRQGRYDIAYNVLGSYARERIADDPELRLVIPDDYALVIRRLAFVPRQAPHAGAARRFIDYLLSADGQRVIAEAGELGALHPQLDGPGTATAMRRDYPDGLRPIPLSPGLLATLDELKRTALLARWQREFHDQPVDTRAIEQFSR
ncbi:ABC transporter substrate-binding protein [Halomonas sp. DP5N14-9]|uniref:ABC transporter substrate-binding protein n=1 Tax=Halomonas sp. DP5N14-9 TaxID=2859075 RepID=UPI0021BD0616|nr:ABC transporter substrate-binding protein [Halomonas sp. DP5N14-9]